MAKMGPPHEAECGEEAVRLAHTSGMPVVETARDLGVSHETVRH